MNSKEKAETLQRYFDRYLEEKDVKNSSITLSHMKNLHGSIIKTTIELKNNEDDNVLEVISDLTVLSSSLTNLIKSNENRLQELKDSSETSHEESNNKPVSKKLVKHAPSLVLFYLDTCPPCRAFLPTWNDMEKKIDRTDMNIVKYSCLERSDECNKINIIESYPTIVVHIPATESTPQSLHKFIGERSVENILKFFKNKTGIEIPL